MHKTSVAIALQVRKPLIDLLNKRLADAVDLSVQAKLAHWNVRGPHFIALHELFDKVADMAQEHADSLAERLAQLGGIAKATLQETVKATSLPAADSSLSGHKEVVTSLSKAIATYANNLREAIDESATKGDQVTSDIFTQLNGEADKNLWFVEAHLQ